MTRICVICEIRVFYYCLQKPYPSVFLESEADFEVGF
jgi:hypothetical protein